MKRDEELQKELQYLRLCTERDTAKILELDMHAIALRHELEQKRRGFALLADLAVTPSHDADYNTVFVSMARRVNTALNMQRTAVLVPAGENGLYKPLVLQGYPAEREAAIAARQIEVPPAFLDRANPVLVTGADPAELYGGIREALALPYLISSPILLHNDVIAIFVTGRVVEQMPFLPRLGWNDVETVQAVATHLAALTAERRMIEAEERTQDELRASRDLAEKNARAKSEFLANMSHEIRTPMNAVLGMIHLLSGTEMSGRQRGYVENAERSAKLLVRIINDILDFSKIEAGRLEVEQLRFSIRDVLNAVQGSLLPSASAKGLALTVSLDSDVPNAVIGDPLRLEQVVLNLANNAVKFTSKGAVGIRVSLKWVRQERVQLLFEVQDTGIGLTEDQIPLLFQPFSQADSSVTRKYGGTGLGLAICRSLVSLMGGTIWCESVWGQGSTFSFTAAFGLPESDGESEASVAREDDFSRLAGMHVLLAEDNDINQMIAVEMLSNKGVAVDVAANGIEALDAIGRNRYDLVLMDIQMPEMDGLTAAGMIRSEPKFDDLPIIAMTAHAMTGDREASLRAGMNDHITKPIEPRVLYETLARWGRSVKG